MPKLDKAKIEIALHNLREYAEMCEAMWDGKRSGIAEDRASCAKDILKNLKELTGLINELESYI